MPSCLLCVRTTTACVYPDGRKKRRIATDSPATQRNSLIGSANWPIVTDQSQDLGPISEALFPLHGFHWDLGGIFLESEVTDTSALTNTITSPALFDGSQGIGSAEYPIVPCEVVEEL